LRARALHYWRRLGAQPLVLGHRGARARAPENTLASFELAATEGADGVELDVRLNRSRDVVVLHDRYLARVTGGADCRDIEQVTNSQLGRLDVGGQRIPLLEQVLRWAGARGMRLNIELKPDVSSRGTLVGRVAALLRGMRNAPELVLLSSLHPGILLELAHRIPDVAIAWVAPPETRLVWRRPWFLRLGPIGINAHTRLLDAPGMLAARRRGASVYAWTVNDSASAQRLARLGVDGIITDDPATIVLALR
jgi:glycerophosphoryl diester phosphodiesterase